ncbi:hypothetical protein EXIGLDRAFT_770871 [Exidia glandulosa HHB12029]|uniref:Uncharacterized protein n=1 Tax=Exidia glandulosa HHB12029 TaxID=1314781 RepID=A0A165GDU0_EXIGL|nr:hypothetical protein EXIGLDRAFT_770871 [Exidia glandulosa HHB12029]
MSVALGSRISTYALLLLVGGRATLQQETTSTIHTVWPNSTAWTLGDGSPLQWSDSSTTACGPFAQLDGTEMVLTFNGTDVTLQGYGIKPDNAPVFGLSAYLDDGNRLYFDVPNRDTIAGGCSTFATYRNLEPDKVHTLRINIDSSAILHYWMGPAENPLKGKEAFLAMEPTPDARVDDPEHGESESSRLREALDALAALQNEVQEMRKRDTLGVETLPDYEPHGVGRE